MSNIYSKEERLEALKLADEIGPVAAAQRLNINLNTLYKMIECRDNIQSEGYNIS